MYAIRERGWLWLSPHAMECTVRSTSRPAGANRPQFHVSGYVVYPHMTLVLYAAGFLTHSFGFCHHSFPPQRCTPPGFFLGGWMCWMVAANLSTAECAVRFGFVLVHRLLKRACACSAAQARSDVCVLLLFASDWGRDRECGHFTPLPAPCCWCPRPSFKAAGPG